MKEPYILIAAHARSGSTYLCRLLEQIRQIKVYFEIFHFQLDVIEQHLKGDYRRIAEILDLSEDPAVARPQIVDQAAKYIQTLAQLNPERTLAFKVFPGHLPANKLKPILCGAELLILLRRNSLHSYISNLIATKTNHWGWHDTSENKVQFDPAKFDQHRGNISGFNNFVRDVAESEGVKFLTLDYETLAYGDLLPTAMADVLSAQLDKVFTCAPREHTSRKQDKRVDALQKVSNPPDMLKHLRKRDLERLLDGRNPDGT